VRSQNMIASAEEGGRVTALLKEDISQMGTKSFGTPSANGYYVFESVAEVHISTGNDADLSSYILTKGTEFDRLVFRKLNYNANGICDALLEVTWLVENNVLKRNCEVLSSKCPNTDFDASVCPESVEMASGVTEFKFLPSKPGKSSSPASSELMFPPPGSPGAFDFRATNASSPLPAKVSLKFSESTPVPSHYNFVSIHVGNCHVFKFFEGEEYAIEFDLPNRVNPDDPCIITGIECSEDERYNPMNMFQVGYDHLSLGLRTTSGAPIANMPDFLFYPPQDDNASGLKRHFKFSVPPQNQEEKSLNACVGITAALYSAARNGGHLDFENFRVFKVTDKIYHFDRSNINYNPSATSTPNKASVKAFELTLSIKRKSESNKTVMVIPVPNNGITGGF